MKNKKRMRQRAAEQAEAEEGGFRRVDDTDSEDDEEQAAAYRAKRKGLKGAKKAKVSAKKDEEEDDDEEVSEEEDEDEPGEEKKPRQKVKYTGVNAKEKCLILSSRGVTSRYRHLMLDLMTLIPNAKKDSKLDTKDQRDAIVEIAEMRNCTSAMFFECRKRTDCYIWMAKTPAGPSVKFHVENVHTMAELKLTGNHLKFSRAALHFAPHFDSEPHLRVLKELLTHLFSTPYRHHKMKPFFDHTLSFYWEDGRVWFRNYQVVHPEGKEVREVGTTLTEAGPRLCLKPIAVFAGAFGGAKLFEDPTYISPNVQRSEAKKQDQGKYRRKVEKKAELKAHKRMNALKPDPLNGLFKGDDDDGYDDDE